MRGLRIPNLPPQPRSVSFPGGGVVGAPNPSLGEQVQAILAGTLGFAIDATDRSTLFQDTAGTIPATTNGDPVARINTKWGTTAHNFTNATPAQQPAVSADGVLADGVDDILIGSASLLSVTNNIPGIFCTYHYKHVAFGGTRYMLSFSTEATNAVRASFYTGVGVAATQGRRLTADALTNVSTASLITAGVFATVSGQLDYAGTGEIYARVDGSAPATATIAGTPGNTGAVNSARVRLFASLGASAYINAHLHRLVCIPRIVSNVERAILEAWVAE